MRSSFEEKLKAQLEAEKVKYSYENTRLKYTIPEKEMGYYPDFIIGGDSEKKLLTFEEIKDKILIEAKGHFDRDTRNKMLWVKKTNPNIDIRIVFESDNYLSKLTPLQRKKKKNGEKFKKQKYSDWCLKHGFPYAIKTIPKEWLKC